MKRTCLRLLLIAVPLGLLAHATLGRAEEETNNFPQITITPEVHWINVTGDRQKFREDQWRGNGVNGGIEDATFHYDFGNDTAIDLGGRAIFNERDYKLSLDLTKTDVGFIRAGFTQYRKYFDSTGGYFAPFTPPSFDLSKELNLDIGNIFVEVGLTLPNWPKIVLGYERQYKNGNKSLLEWGSVTQGTESRKIFPSLKNIDEHTDIFRASIDHDIGVVHLGDNFRYERYNDKTLRADTSLDLNTAASKTVAIRETYKHDAFYNTFHMDSHLNEKVYWSLGYLYNNLDGEGGLNVFTPPPLTPFDKNWVTRAIDLDQNSHVVNLNAMFGPFAGLVIYAGAQGERTETHGFTDALLTEGVSPATANLIRSNTDKDSLDGTLGLRYTKIPFTTLYAEGKVTVQQIDQKERETEDAVLILARDTDADVFRQDYRAGFSTAPLRRVNLSGRYRHLIYENNYDHEVDTVQGYPAFITMQDFISDEVMGKLTLRPWTRLTVALTYQLVTTDINSANGGIPLLAPAGSKYSGNYDASIYSISTTITPFSRLYLTGLFSYQDTRTVAFDNQSPSVIEYNGSVYTAIGTAGFALDEKTDITVEYSYSRSDNFTNNSADGLPLGLDNQRHGVIAGITRKFTDNVSARLRYGFYEYNETSNGGVDDYHAHLVSGSVAVRF